jgi:hypothetical protein
MEPEENSGTAFSLFLLRHKEHLGTLKKLMNERTGKIYAALNQLCDALDLGRSKSSNDSFSSWPWPLVRQT